MTSFLKDGHSRPVAMWLLCVTLIVFAMVVVGGATRLTGSGLSITQWRPVSGAIPPMTASAWERDFALYRATPQYRLVNRGMSLSEFRFIFWWEWAHRLLGRLAGAAFAVPLAGFLFARAMPRRLIGQLVIGTPITSPTRASVVVTCCWGWWLRWCRLVCSG